MGLALPRPKNGATFQNVVEFSSAQECRRFPERGRVYPTGKRRHFPERGNVTTFGNDAAFQNVRVGLLAQMGIGATLQRVDATWKRPRSSESGSVFSAREWRHFAERGSVHPKRKRRHFSKRGVYPTGKFRHSSEMGLTYLYLRMAPLFKAL